MRGILVVTHHTLAEAFVKTSEMLVGKHEFVKSLGLVEGQTPEDFGMLIRENLEEMNKAGYEEVLVVADLFGGTPCNQTLQLLKDYKIQIVTGANLQMLVQLIMSIDDESNTPDLMESVIKESQEGILYLNKMFQNLIEEV